MSSESNDANAINLLITNTVLTSLIENSTPEQKQILLKNLSALETNTESAELLNCDPLGKKLLDFYKDAAKKGSGN